MRILAVTAAANGLRLPPWGSPAAAFCSSSRFTRRLLVAYSFASIAARMHTTISLSLVDNSVSPTTNRTWRTRAVSIACRNCSNSNGRRLSRATW